MDTNPAAPYMSTIVLSSCGHTVRLFGLEVMSEPSGQDATLAAENETRYWSPNHALSYCLEGLTPMSMSRLPGKTSFCSGRKAFMIESHIVATIIIEMHLPGHRVEDILYSEQVMSYSLVLRFIEFTKHGILS
jgi:hypothetical protein